MVLAESDFRAALLAKLVEEDQELQAARADELLTVLANVMEVFDTMPQVHKRSSSSVRPVVT
ncbi:nucleoside triphosphate pyrophosphohydrolase family protein [Hymenobacter glacialis]|uniref:Uncharacterized protein n=1 Tax=Hymenobacter glacialis TaxID=1908236 RepID=A0A1G1TCK2_9BACT|nr:hypothetical protein [Hymenobacter glacialis]OGX88602.1 hypothetical protein BEN48_09515 [Hymenobacter glacialis]